MEVGLIQSVQGLSVKADLPNEEGIFSLSDCNVETLPSVYPAVPMEFRLETVTSTLI